MKKKQKRRKNNLPTEGKDQGNSDKKLPNERNGQE